MREDGWRKCGEEPSREKEQEVPMPWNGAVPSQGAQNWPERWEAVNDETEGHPPGDILRCNACSVHALCGDDNGGCKGSFDVTLFLASAGSLSS